MNNKGFVTSALLYGILSMFLVLILGTVAIIANRKLSNDKIKQSALDDVQGLYTKESCFVVEGSTITGYKDDDSDCTSTVFIPEEIGGTTVDTIKAGAFLNKGIEVVTIKDNITTIESGAFSENDNNGKGITFILKGKARGLDKSLSTYVANENASIQYE